MPSLGEEVRRLRKASGITQEALAKASGVTQGFITQLETGKLSGFSVQVLFRISAALGVQSDHFSQFFTDESTETPDTE